MKLLNQPAIRQSFGLVVGLVLGVAGAILFKESMPPEQGSVAAALEQSEADLRKARQEIATMKADGKGSRSRRSVRDGMRSVVERIRRGEEVSLDDIFWTMKPWLQDMSPLFDRMREVGQENRFDSIAGAYRRDYDLSEADHRALKDWLMMKGAENAREYREVVYDPTSGFVDFMRVSQFDEDDIKGIDEFMESRLEGEKLAQFKAERLQERVASVEEEANRRLERINRVVKLEDDQLDAMFAVMARGADNYQPGMEFDGMGGESTRLEGGQREAAIRSVLRGPQLRRYEQYRDERRADAEADMRKIGLSLPKDWHLLDDDEF